MMSRYYILIYGVLLSCLLPLSAQDNTQRGTNTHQAAYNLMDYQSKHPTDPLSYFRLGNIYYDLYHSEHPIRHYTELLTDLYNVRLFYGNFLYYLQDQSIRHEEYQVYPHSGKNITHDELTEEVRRRMRETEMVKEQATELYQSYYTLCNRYERCRLLYTHFAEMYPREKNAHLLLNDSSMSVLTQLMQLSDSVHADIVRYEQTLHNYPIAHYHPLFRWQEIRLYRVDGLTRTDFLQDDIALWNYGEWVHRFLDEQQGLYYNYYRAIAAELSLQQSDETLLNTIRRLDYGSYMDTWIRIRQGGRRMRQSAVSDTWQTDIPDYEEVILPYVQLELSNLCQLRELYHSLSSIVSTAEMQKYAPVTDTMAYHTPLQVLSDARMALDTAETAYTRICRMVVEHAAPKPEPFRLYRNEITGETVDAALLNRLGISGEGKVVCVIAMGYHYMAVLDNRKTVLFDTHEVLGPYEFLSGDENVVGARKISSGTIAVLMPNRIIFVDDRGREKM